MKKIATENEKQFFLKSTNNFRPSLKQIGNSISEIKDHYTNTGVAGMSVLPSALQPDLSEIKDEILPCLQRLNEHIEQKYFSSNNHTFLYLSKSLCMAMGLMSSPRPQSAGCDVFIVVRYYPILMLTVGEETPNTKKYNMSAAKGVLKSLERFVDENFEIINFVIERNILRSPDTFCKKVLTCVSKASERVPERFLLMSPSKYEKILIGVWACISETKPVFTDTTEELRFIRFLTKEQAIILVENIDKRAVHVTSLPGTGATTLMLEVTRRLSRMAHTLLVCRTEDKDQFRSVLPPSVTVVDQFFTDLTEYRHVVDVTNTVRSIDGRIWQFFSEDYQSEALSDITQENTEKRNPSDNSDKREADMRLTKIKKLEFIIGKKSTVRDELTTEVNKYKEELLQLKEEMSNCPDKWISKQMEPVLLLELPKVSGPILHFDEEVANKDVCHITRSDELVNQPPAECILPARRMTTFRGTTTFSPLVLSFDFPLIYTSQYFEVHANLQLKRKAEIWHTLLEVWLVEDGHLEDSFTFTENIRSWGIRLGGCMDHFPNLCTRIYDAGTEIRCVSVPVSNTPSTFSSRRYGIVVNAGRGRIVLTDIDRRIIIHKFDVAFEKNIWPAFGVGSESDYYAVKMELVCGRNVSMSKEKESLILGALSMK